MMYVNIQRYIEATTQIGDSVRVNGTRSLRNVKRRDTILINKSSAVITKTAAPKDAGMEKPIVLAAIKVSVPPINLGLVNKDSALVAVDG